MDSKFNQIKAKLKTKENIIYAVVVIAIAAFFLAGSIADVG